MNEIVNNFLLARSKFMSEMHLRQLGFTYNKEYKSLKKQEIHDMLIKTKLIKLVFNMTWPMVILKI